MPYNGSGTFTRLYNWIQDRVDTVKIQAARMDAEFDGIAAGLTNAITRDGQSTVLADLPMSGKRLTGLGLAAAGDHAVSVTYGDSRYLTRQGEAPTSANFSMNGFKVVGLGAATAGDHAVSVTYGDSRYLTRQGEAPTTANFSMNGFKVVGLGAATAGDHAVSVTYGDTRYLTKGAATSNATANTTVTRDGSGQTNFAGGQSGASYTGAAVISQSGAINRLFTLDPQGLCVTLGGTDFVVSTSPSDRRLKDQIAPANYDALGKIERLAFRSFEWRSAAFRRGHVPCGVIAQEAETIEPAWITTVGDEAMKGLDVSILLASALRAIQQLSAKVKALEG